MWRIVERQALDARRLPLGVEWQDSFALGAEDHERDAELAAALAALPARRRLVVFLRYFADLPYGDIARLCGIDEGTVGATLAAVHADLRKALQVEEVEL